MLPREIGECWRAARRLDLLSAWRMAVLLGISVGAAVFEGFGVAMFLPVVEFVDKGGTRQALVNSDASTAKLVPVFDAMGLPVTLLSLMAVVALMFLIRQAFVFGRNVYGVVLAQRFTRAVRNHGFARLLRSDLAFFHNRDTGTLVNVLTVEAVRSGGVVLSLTNLAGTFALFPVYFVVLLMMSFQMTLLACVVVVVAFVVNRTIVRRMRLLGGEVTILNGRLGQFLVERLTGVRTVKLDHQEHLEIERQETISQDLTRRNVKIAEVQGRIELIVEPLVVVAGLTIMYLALKFLDMALAQIGLFVFILIRLMPIARSFFINRNNAAALTESVLLVARTLDQAASARRITGGGHTLRDVGSGIVFDHVTFTYRPQDGLVLKDVSLTIPARRMVALVGPSGAGKSTLVDLIPRLIVPDSGRIMIGDRPIEEYDLGSLRKNVSIVSQSTYVFNDTIAANIRYGRSEANDDEVRVAARLAYADEFIARLADGYGTLCGENGCNLSGGQRQRLILARSLLRQSQILVLDEPTSALDSESEAYISRSLEELGARGETTLVVIAHRLSTIRRADLIAVVDRGEIRAVGTHDQLSDSNDWYGEIIRLQGVDGRW
ncbi:MAG: ABC transporter ATP-binding protein/permease [Proteobacteria bacterium]|nr:ABC transporter ATP-binding protein/permease [Pseudomonadota bacterium]